MSVVIDSHASFIIYWHILSCTSALFVWLACATVMDKWIINSLAHSMNMMLFLIHDAVWRSICKAAGPFLYNLHNLHNPRAELVYRYMVSGTYTGSPVFFMTDERWTLWRMVSLPGQLSQANPKSILIVHCSFDDGGKDMVFFYAWTYTSNLKKKFLVIGEDKFVGVYKK